MRMKRLYWRFKKLVLSNPYPGGGAFPSSSILTEPLHLRQDISRHGDVVALEKGIYLKDAAMDCVVVSGLAKSCLSNQANKSDFSLRLAEKAKFTKVRRSSCPVASSTTMRLIPFVVSHLGLHSPHMQAILKEFATSVVTNPTGCSLLHGPFAVTSRGALQKILRTWGSALTWTLQREHAGQIDRGMQTLFACSGFLFGWGQILVDEGEYVRDGG